MARAKDNGNGRLEESTRELQKAQRDLLQSQILMQQNFTAAMTRLTELERETAERFSRIEAILLQHSRILAEHTQILERLPEAVREKIGFRAPG